MDPKIRKTVAAWEKNPVHTSSFETAEQTPTPAPETDQGIIDASKKTGGS